jgi:ERCC4-type nuclease
MGNGPENAVSIGVERKVLLDLLQSMTSGRLSGHQMVGLTNEYDWVYLLVEGVWRPDSKTGVMMRTDRNRKWIPAAFGSRRFMARDVYNFLNSLTIMCNVVVIMTSNKWETAKWLDSCHGWWQKQWDHHKSHLQFHKPVTHAHLSKPSLSTRIASQFDGIGWDKARKLGERFKTPLDLLMSSKEDLSEVHGIGRKLADSIIKQRNGD